MTKDEIDTLLKVDLSNHLKKEERKSYKKISHEELNKQIKEDLIEVENFFEERKIQLKS